MKLTIELVPKTCFFRNVRAEVNTKTWDVLRTKTYRKAKYRCEICGDKGPDHPVECHEIWDYDDKKHTQTLKGLIALCPACHEVKHMGLAHLRGRGSIAIQHFAKINKISIDRADYEVTQAFHKYNERSQYDWELDISWLDDEIEPYDEIKTLPDVAHFFEEK